MITLKASDLRSKWGFSEGDILDDLLFDNGFENVTQPKDAHLRFEHEVLARLVEQNIVPKLPETAKVSRIGTCHNPIRLKNHEAVFDDFAINLTEVEVLAVAEQVRAEYDAHGSQP